MATGASPTENARRKVFRFCTTEIDATPEGSGTEFLGWVRTKKRIFTNLGIPIFEVKTGAGVCGSFKPPL